MIQILKRNWQLIVIVILAFCLLKSCKQTETETVAENKINTDSLQKSNENTIFQYDAILEQNSQITDSINKVVARLKITEAKLYQLQKKTAVKPAYVTEITDCNDTIQSIYYIGTIKDSLCNYTISQKNEIINKQDKVIVNDSSKIKLLNKVIENKDLTIESQDKLIVSETKKTRSEVRKKTFWQIVAGVLTILKFIK